ncbi:Tankyrase-2 [Trichoplax sp. H2]|nr:Tankyrase-2 [Trichoplax sp. H2]|eukprot:RDD37435.1 Tankyrase-2 [Trichoplax sp. H2]
MGCGSSKSTEVQKSSNLLTVPDPLELHRDGPISNGTSNHSIKNSLPHDSLQEKKSEIILQEQEDDQTNANPQVEDHEKEPAERSTTSSERIARDVSIDTRITYMEPTTNPGGESKLSLVDETNEKNEEENENRARMDQQPSKGEENKNPNLNPVFIIGHHDEEAKSTLPTIKSSPVIITGDHIENAPKNNSYPIIVSDQNKDINLGDLPPPSTIEITREDINNKVNELKISGGGLNIETASNMQASSIIYTDAIKDDTSIVTPSMAVPNSFANDNWNLWEAVKYDNIDEVIRLCQKDSIKLDAMMGLENKSILHLAAERNSVQSAEYLLDSGKMDPNVKDEILQGIPLHHAAENGCIAVSKLFIKHGALINAVDLLQNTPLHVAYAECQDEMVEFLIKNGADTELLNSDGDKPLEQPRD